MKDKLYKTGKKASYYQAKKAIICAFVFGAFVSSVSLPLSNLINKTNELPVNATVEVVDEVTYVDSLALTNSGLNFGSNRD